MILIDNLKTNYHIVYNKDADEATRFASTELQKYLYLATDTLIPLFSDKCERRGCEIHIGLNVRDDSLSKYCSKMSDEGFCIKTLDNDDICIFGKTGRSNLYGVYYLLEKLIDLKCYSKDCIEYNNLSKIEFNKLDIEKDFVFEYREVYFTDAFNETFASMNMLNSNLANLSSRVGGKTKWFNFHHSFQDLVSTKDYFDTHPEYFSEIDGKRIKEHTELCLSNEDVYNLALEKCKSWIKENPDCKVFSVSQDEWMGHFTKMACECEKCKAFDLAHGAQSASIIRFVNRITEDINKEYPDKLIHTFAYQYSRKPPIGINVNKNVIVRLCNIECSWDKSIEEGSKDKNSENAKFLADLTGWSKLTNRLYLWDYTVNFRNYLLPFPCLRSMYNNILFYKKHNIKGVLMQGNFSAGGKGYCDELKSYLCARLLAFDERSLEEIVLEFCKHYYKEAYLDCYNYIMLFEYAVKGHKLWLYDDADNEMFTDELVSKAKVMIESALKNVNNSSKEIKNRVLSLYASYKYLYAVRLPMDYLDRNKETTELIDLIRYLKITEIFERTNLDYSFEVIKTSRYAKDRPNWYSLYYIMR